MSFLTGSWEALAYTITPQATYNRHASSSIRNSYDKQYTATLLYTGKLGRGWEALCKHRVSGIISSHTLVTDPSRNEKKKKTQPLN